MMFMTKNVYTLSLYDRATSFNVTCASYYYFFYFIETFIFLINIIIIIINRNRYYNPEAVAVSCYLLRMSVRLSIFSTDSNLFPICIVYWY